MTITIPDPVVWIAVGAALATLFWFGVVWGINRRKAKGGGS